MPLHLLAKLFAAPVLLAFGGVAISLATAVVAQAAPQGDPARGHDVYFQCLACHSIDANRVGPMHRGLFGRRAGSVAGFNYSSAMKSAGEHGLVWSEGTLDTYLTNPAKLVPGNKMLFGGFTDAQTRADVIAYLKQATEAEATTRK
jgi:cytochrome c